MNASECSSTEVFDQDTVTYSVATEPLSNPKPNNTNGRSSVSSFLRTRLHSPCHSTSIDGTSHTTLQKETFLDHPPSPDDTYTSEDGVSQIGITEEEQWRRMQRQRRKEKRKTRKTRKRKERKDVEVLMVGVRGWMRTAAGFVSCFCFGFFMFFTSVWATSWGKAFFDQLESMLHIDAFGTESLHFLSFSLLLCATLTRILHRPPTSLNERGRICTTPFRVPNLLHYTNCFRHKTPRGDGDPNYTFLAFLIFVIPTLLYGGIRLWSHLHTTGNISHRHLANDFGKLSLMAMSWFLIPVSRHSTLLSAMGWDPIHAAQLHTCAGYVALFGGLVHAGYYTVIYIKIDEVGFWSQVFPERECWSIDELFKTNRKLSEESKCYEAFMNMTGVFSAFCFFILTCTSVWWVRRRYYKVFYLTHIIFGTSVFLGLALHYNKAIMYICPSMIYYLASLGPYWIKALAHYWKGGTRLLAVNHIPNSGGCVELSFQMGKSTGWNAGATALQIVATQYAKIHVPGISRLWHPFTVFSTPSPLGDDTETLNICFRQCGSFTTELARKLKQRSFRPPMILVDGLYRGADRMTQALRHDTVVMVAGGIGIVSYITMVRLLYLTLMVKGRDRGGSLGIGPKLPTKKVVLLWVCRDEGLIDHFCKTQFDRLVRRDVEGGVTEGVVDVENSDVRLHIVIFHTTRAAVEITLEENSDEKLLHTEENIVPTPSGPSRLSRGEPFEPSPLSTAGKSLGFTEDIVSSLVFATIAWGGLYFVWDNYHNMQHKHSTIGNRIYSTLETLLLSVSVPLAGMCFWKICNGEASLLRRMRRYRYNAVTSDIPTEDIVGGSIHASDGIIPITAESSVSTEPIEINAKECASLELVKEHVNEELKRTQFVVDINKENNGSCSGSTSGSSDTFPELQSQNPVSLTASERCVNSVEEVSVVHSTPTSGIIIDHRTGRPGMEEVFDELFEDTRMPGIFLCGPTQLLNAVTDTIMRKRCVSMCNRIKGRQMRPRCAIYKEGFET